MPVTNLLKVQVDQPVFEWMRFAPLASSFGAVLAAGDDTTGRFMYYSSNTSLYSYDTYSDSWQGLATCPASISGPVAMKYTKTVGGFRGDAIAGTSTTITIAGLSRSGMVGKTIRIIAGTGAGQERTISSVADAVIADFGVATTANASIIVDSTKKWRINQWDNYSCRIILGSGVNQVRKIQYNDATTLTFSDTNYQPIDPFNNQGFSNSYPYTVPVNTAGSQSQYVIESCVLTVPTWTVTPDNTSVYQIIGGGLWVLSNLSPNCSFNFYDILTDSWILKTNMGSLVTSSLTQDMALERIGEIGSAFVSGVTASSATSRTLVHSAATYEVDRYANYQIRITAGTGIGQKRRIVGNTATTFHIERSWGITPDATSEYAIYGDTDAIWFTGGLNISTFLKYSVESDIWSTSHISDTGMARNISATPTSGAGYEAPHTGFGVSSIIRAASGILTVAVNAAGANYVVGDLVNCTTSGTSGQVWVTAVNATGGVTSLELADSGQSYVAGSSATSSGTGTGLTITLTVGPTARVTTALSHDFKTGDTITIAGCATDTWFNTNHTPIGYINLTQFSINATGSTASPTAASSQNTGLLVDSSKAWITNEHVGKLCYIHSAGTVTSTQSRRISANTATTLSLFGSITSATNGTSRYVIAEPSGFGAMQTNKIVVKGRSGWATSGTATTLVDSTKNWTNNQWINCRVRVVCGTGIGNEAVITGNSATSLTVASWANATPDATSKYEIMDSFGVVTTSATSSTTITDVNKNWTTNILAGKRLRIIAGTGMGTELIIQSNTATVITLTTTTTTDLSTMYVILDSPLRNGGISLVWLYGLTDTKRKGRWLFSSRASASNQHDIYDIPSNTWDLAPFVAVNSETFGTGSMYSYDGKDGIIFTRDATGRLCELNINTFQINPCGITPYAHGSSSQGNRMELIKTADGLEYIYIMRHSGTEMWRTLKFW